MNRDYFNKGGLDLSKEVLWVSVGQLTSKLQAVKFGGVKKILPHSIIEVARGRLLDDGIILQVVTLQPVDLQRPTVPLWKDLNLLNILKCNLEE